MSENVNLDVDTTEAERKIDRLDAKIEDTGNKLVQMGDDVEKATVESFNEVKGMMQTSYMMVSGITQVVGGNMSQVFSSIFQIAISAIGTYQSIAAAAAASGPGGWIQAGIMMSSLGVAIFNLMTLSEGQKDLSRRLSGLNMSLHGISSLIGYNSML